MIRSRSKKDNSETTPNKERRISITFIVGMAVLGFIAQFQWIGLIVITIFAIYALVTRMPARRVYTIALIMLGMVPLSILIGNWLIAQNFAAYSFLAFVYGIFIMTAELRRELHGKKVKDTTQQGSGFDRA
jgi:hypothetical protein